MKLKKIFNNDAIYGMNCRLGRSSFLPLHYLFPNRTVLNSPDETLQFFILGLQLMRRNKGRIRHHIKTDVVYLAYLEIDFHIAADDARLGCARLAGFGWLHRLCGRRGRYGRV